MKEAALFVALLSFGCGDDDALDGGAQDSGADSVVADVSETVDGSADAPDVMDGGPDDMDAGPDVPADGSVDALDGAVDAFVDAPIDAPIDTALDAPIDAALDTMGDGGFLTTCDGACAATRLEARFGAVTEIFDAAYFGFNADGTLYVEAYGGAADGCPQMDSPSPDRTLILGRLPVPMDRNEVTLTASLLDFEGTLTSAPFLSSPMAHARGAAARIMPLDDAFIRIDFDAMFDGGVVDGAIYATHCASLDD